MSAAELMIPREWTHSYETVALDDEDIEVVDTLAATDALTYERGETPSTIWEPSKHEAEMDTFWGGRAGEVATCQYLNLWEPDALDIRGRKGGDAGYDLTWRGHEVDAKAHERYADLDPGNLMVDTKKVERGYADVYVSTQVVSDRAVVLHGWLRRDELKELGRVWNWNTENYVAFADELHSMGSLRNISRE